MSTELDAGAADPAPGAVGRLLRALTDAGGGGTLLAAGADTYGIQTNEGLALLLAAPSGGDAIGEVQRRVLGAFAGVERGVMHALVVGGDAALAHALPPLEVQPDRKRALRVHLLDRELARFAVGGKLSPTLARALVRARKEPGLEALSREELAERLAAGREALAAERRFAVDLKRRFPIVNVAIAGTCAVLFGLELLFGGATIATYLRMGGDLGRLALPSEPWRLLAAPFLHGGLAHIAMNLSALLSLGPFLEGLLGRRRFLTLYTLSALGGALASALLHPNVVSVGASGAIWGLMGGALALSLRPRGLLPPLTQARMKPMLLRTLGLNVLISFVPGIDLFAHFGGGLTGLALCGSGLLTLGLAPDRDARSRDGLGWSALALGCAALLAGSIYLGLARGRAWELVRPPAAVRVQLPEAGLSIEMPAGLAPRPLERQGQSVLFTFGQLDHDPMLLEVVTGPVDPSIDPDALLEEVRKDTVTAPEATIAQPARIETVGAWKAVIREDHFKNGLDRVNYITLAHDRVVAVHVYRGPSTPAAWRALEPGFLRSLRDERAAGPTPGR